MIELSAELRQALRDHPAEPIRLIDSQTNNRYVLRSLEAYENLKATRTEDFHPSEAYGAIDRAFAEG